MRPTSKSIKALKYLIGVSPDATNFTKRLCFWLIDQSSQITQSVCVSIPSSSDDTYAKQAGYCIHNMVSSAWATHLNDIMAAIGTDFIFSSHSGIYNENGVRVLGGYTIWLSPKHFDHQAKRIEFDPKTIHDIKLANIVFNHRKEPCSEPHEMCQNLLDRIARENGQE